MMEKIFPTFSEYLHRRYDGPFSAVDIIIRHDDGNKKGIVLEERLNPPHGLAFPGGMGERIPHPNNAYKEAEEETNLKVVLDEPLKPFLALSGIYDDPRAFISTNVYTATGHGVLRRGDDAAEVFLYDHDELYRLTQQKERWSTERHRRIAVMYLSHVGYEKAAEEAIDVERQILLEYEEQWKNYLDHAV